jgi:hypothetical protein
MGSSHAARHWGLVATLVGLAPAAFGAAEPLRPISFNRDIRPLIAENCFHCHGPDPASRKAKLRFDREDGFFAAREKDGPTVVRGKPEESELWKRLIATDPDDVMPPPKEHKELKPEQKALFKRWIAEGAKWEPHWSFIVPSTPEQPKPKGAAWVRNPIDGFVLARLEAAGLQPAPEADRRTLARRVALDLTGLPPTPEQVEAFVADQAPNAYEKLVDQLLASPRYGEHRARYWLDAARYADTHGLHFDNYREMWPYRDWVINAFNANQPFDQFTIEQIAGDLLPNPTREQQIATGFHRCNMTTNEGGTIAEENLANYARDRVETTSWVWLGLTANCAVCHDHKFDPITQKDFYAMSAYFRNTTQGALDGNIKDTPPILMMPLDADSARWNALPGEIEAGKQAAAQRRKELRGEFDTWLTTATMAEWEAELAKSGAPDARLPLAGSPDGTLAGKAIVPTVAEPLAFEDGGPVGKAARLGEKSGFVVPDPDFGDFERDKPYAVSCWVKLPKEQGGSAAILGRMDNEAGHRGWDLWLQDNEFAAHLINKWPDDALKVRTTGGAAKRDVWLHVCLSYDGSAKPEGMKIFVDGKQVKTDTEAKTLKGSTRTTAPFKLGQRKTDANIKSALLQDVRLYNRQLPASEIARQAATPKVRELLAKEAKDRDAKAKDQLFDMWDDTDAKLKEANDKVAALENEKKTIKERGTVTHIQEEKKDSKAMARILFRGEYDKPKDQVEPGVFGFLAPLPSDAPKNRLGLARWLVSKDNSLTPRVIVNRFWQELFGTGLVRTSEDLGIMGDAPSHPELLDFLAVEFRNGWDIKKLVKLMVMSATYRQAPVTTPDKIEKDPANRLLSRGPRFRMDAEMVRDYALAASGLLSPRIGGPSVKTYHPDGVWDAVGMREGNTKIYKRDDGEALYRRSVYWFWKRMAPPASMEILNAPNRETACVRRERTDTPLQALVTLNDPQLVEAARVLAEKAMKAGKDDAERQAFAARRILARPLNAAEAQVVARIHAKLLERYRAKPDEAKALLAVGETKADATLDASALAALTMTCNELLNLDEVLNK